MDPNRRRQTLGQMSPAQMNSRLSMGPSRIMKEGKAGSKPIPPRPSLAPPGTANANRPQPSGRIAPTGAPLPRRSSAYGKPGNGIKSDPRPVSDKAYQQACIRTVISYLSTQNYDHPISAKVSRPSLLTPPPPPPLPPSSSATPTLRPHLETVYKSTIRSTGSTLCFDQGLLLFVC